jgi:Mor family transcriptional regulator
MMDFESFERLKAEIEGMVLSHLPNVNQEAVCSLSIDLTQFVRKTSFSYSGVKVAYDDYTQIYRQWRQGSTQAELAEKYNLSICTIQKICSDKLLPPYRGR